MNPGDRMVDAKGISMVYVPAGKFLMGSDNISEAEKPIHEQFIESSFWLDLTPVTNLSYACFIDEGGYNNREFWTPNGWDWAVVVWAESWTQG